VFRRAIVTISLVVIVIVGVGFVDGGVPALRHDWPPVSTNVLLALASESGWNPIGIGSPNGYPSTFEIVPLEAAFGALFGPYAEHIAIFSVTYLSIAFGAARLARTLGAGRLAQISLATIALFNPWTYTELIAGHTFMLFSYGATFWIVAEAVALRPSPLRLALLAPLAAPQIQFLVIDALVYGWLGLRHRIARALGVMGLTLLPIVVGVPLTRSTLIGTPVTLAWEKGLSIAPIDAVQLRGYFTHYDALLAPVAAWSMPAFALAALAGLVVAIARRERYAAFLATVTTVPLAWSFGTKGPFGALFAWTVQHVPEAALFRELYDLIGFTAIGYVACTAVLAARLRAATIVTCAIAVAGIAGWFVAPPARWWVYRERIPTSPIVQAPHTRFALLPSTQPLQFGDVGSGVDPEVASHPHDVQPLNEQFPRYPIDAAIARYALNRDARSLAALGVTHVYARPWLHTDDIVRSQFAFPLREQRRSGASSAAIERAIPEMTLLPLPNVGTLAARLGAGDVFFGDAARATGDVPAGWRRLERIEPIVAPARDVAAADGWVDARFAFTQRPDWAQAFGGALTTNATSTLDIPPARALLVWVDGTLRDEHGTTVATTTAYRWVARPPAATELRCTGTCLVAAAGAPPDAPLEPPEHPYRVIPFRLLAPWLAVVTLPPGPEGLLRYNVAYDDRWTAFDGAAGCGHVRVDATVNGWLMPARSSTASVIVVQIAALAISSAEAIAIAGSLARLVPMLRRRFASRE